MPMVSTTLGELKPAGAVLASEEVGGAALWGMRYLSVGVSERRGCGLCVGVGSESDSARLEPPRIEMVSIKGAGAGAALMGKAATKSSVGPWGATDLTGAGAAATLCPVAFASDSARSAFVASSSVESDSTLRINKHRYIKGIRLMITM